MCLFPIQYRCNVLYSYFTLGCGHIMLYCSYSQQHVRVLYDVGMSVGAHVGLNSALNYKVIVWTVSLRQS